MTERIKARVRRTAAMISSVVALLAFLAQADAEAHRAFAAEFDAARAVEIRGIVSKAELVASGYRARDGSNRAVWRTPAFADGRPLFFVDTRPPDAP